ISTALKANLFSTEIANGNSGTASTINWNAGRNQALTLTGNCTITFTAPVGGTHLQLKLTQDGTGGRTVTWPTQGVAAGNIAWVGKTVITLSTAAGAVDFINGYYDGTVYWIQYGNNFG